MDMEKNRREWWVRGGVVLAVLGLVVAAARPVFAGPAPSILVRAFEFPLSSANGITGDLIVPIGSASGLSFDSGNVAIGNLPIATLPGRSGARRQSRAQRLLSASGPAPRARLLLNGVTDADGSLVSNTGNQLIIDAAVTPESAALAPQPFTFAFDISGGLAFLDVPLPVAAGADGPVRVQVLGVTVLDPDGHVFAALGFELPVPQATQPPSVTPRATPTPEAEGRCFRGPNCTGQSVALSQEHCCRAAGLAVSLSGVTSWCPPDQIDPSTGGCEANACQTCGDCGDRPDCNGPCAVVCADGSMRSGACGTDSGCHCSATCGPTPSPTAGPCANLSSCSGDCSLTCADGTTVVGQCGQDRNGTCECTAVCAAPTPCGIGECFDTIALRCTGQPCGGRLRCPLPNQFCDVSGRRCPCQPPPRPLPRGHICCECKERVPACFDFSYAEVQPICPPGCDAFLGQECDRTSDTCVALAPCATDQDCDDGNGCTFDRCTAGGCAHDCVCVGPEACGPGPEQRPH
jgi:hypothetical protein